MTEDELTNDKVFTDLPPGVNKAAAQAENVAAKAAQIAVENKTKTTDGKGPRFSFVGFTVIK